MFNKFNKLLFTVVLIFTSLANASDLFQNFNINNYQLAFTDKAGNQIFVNQNEKSVVSRKTVVENNTNYSISMESRSLPTYFNPELYVQLHPGLKNEANELKAEIAAYAMWQYAFYGQMNNLNCLPVDFNPMLSIELHPGLKEEATNKGIDPIEYAKWQYAFHGFNNNQHYLPLDFDPDTYVNLNPGLRNEALEYKWDISTYAKWHYAFHGYKSLKYKV